MLVRMYVCVSVPVRVCVWGSGRVCSREVRRNPIEPGRSLMSGIDGACGGIIDEEKGVEEEEEEVVVEVEPPNFKTFVVFSHDIRTILCKHSTATKNASLSSSISSFTPSISLFSSIFFTLFPPFILVMYYHHIFHLHLRYLIASHVTFFLNPSLLFFLAVY